MSAKKNRIRRGGLAFIALAVIVAGCAPPGPRALLRGKELLDRGKAAAAVDVFKIATSLLATNAQAWNYLGVAEQRAGRPADAALAYQRALTLDRDLVEAHYNLGCLWLEQNNPGAARDEFTAYTLRRPNDAKGWVKLGLAQLRRHDLAEAEKKFSTALLLNPNHAEALNGLGLARLERGLPQEAVQYFATAVRAHPDYAPALLNLAVVEDEFLRNRALASREYLAYLALKPRPADWEAVRTLLQSRQEKPPAQPTPAPSQPPPAAPSQSSAPKFQTEAAVVPAPIQPRHRPETEESQTPKESRPVPQPSRPSRVAAAPSHPPPETAASPQVVQVRPEPVLNVAPQTQASAESPAIEPPPEDKAPEKKSFAGHLNPLRWFGSSAPEKGQAKTSANSASQLPPADRVLVVAPAPRPARPAPPTFPRYSYPAPPKPAAGDRPKAERDFTMAQQFEQGFQTELAMQSYRSAAQKDPSWFEAQYNYGVLAYRLHHYRQALEADEMALAIRPDSPDARYIFALALTASGYVLDARNELEKILATHPDQARVHLELGNLYAQKLDDPERARTHYLKVLALDPDNPKATEIRFWLSAHPPAT
ncbi:MAG: tetratricopeptide repeat protein [Verrucomicrobiota bacterium]|nr:tetratricopeptide repeat protein [Verrucomicrobiota bacterium]